MNVNVSTSQCSRCEKIQPTSEFQLHTRTGKPLRMCKQCRAPKMRWVERNPDKVQAIRRRVIESGQGRRDRLRREYGITSEDFDLMLQFQGSGCAICKANKPGGKHKAFHVDHDHKTGVVRGILCTNCNLALGYFKDDPELLKSAATYLKAARSRR